MPAETERGGVGTLSAQIRFRGGSARRHQVVHLKTACLSHNGLARGVALSFFHAQFENTRCMECRFIEHSNNTISNANDTIVNTNLTVNADNRHLQIIPPPDASNLPLR